MNKSEKLRYFSTCGLETSIGEIYRLAQDCAKEILVNYYGEEEKITFPIDIVGLIQKEGLKITLVNQDPLTPGFYSGMKDDLIVLVTKPTQIQRFALSKTFCGYLLKSSTVVKEGEVENSETNWKDQVFLAFLLFPCELVIKHYEEYKNELLMHNSEYNEFEFIRSLAQKNCIDTLRSIPLVNIIKNYLGTL